MVFLLARLEPGGGPYARQGAPPGRSVAQVAGGRVSAIQRSFAGQSPGGNDFMQQVTLAEAPWALEGAPVWVRFWPLVGMTDMGGDHTLRVELKEWR